MAQTWHNWRVTFSHLRGTIVAQNFGASVAQVWHNDFTGFSERRGTIVA